MDNFEASDAQVKSKSKFTKILTDFQMILVEGFSSYCIISSLAKI